MLVNLTPHPVTLVSDGGSVAIPPGGNAPRVAARPDRPAGTATHDGVTVPVVRNSLAPTVQGLPAPADGQWY
jgi:hypothetical protein